MAIARIRSPRLVSLARHGAARSCSTLDSVRVTATATIVPRESMILLGAHNRLLRGTSSEVKIFGRWYYVKALATPSIAAAAAMRRPAVSSREARQSYVPATFAGCAMALPPARMFDMSNLLVQRTNFAALAQVSYSPATTPCSTKVLASDGEGNERHCSRG
jgi:hypothetical protein